jgi:hypothetical protein
MKINKTILGMIAVAGLAYAAGHVSLFSGGPNAWAGPEDDYQITEEMQAYAEAGRPGEHHKYLDSMVGQWDGLFNIYMEPGQEPMISRGTVTREWILDGRFLQETVEATSDWGTFSGLGFFGYDNVDQQYEIVWMDSMSTGIYSETGTYDAETKILKTQGTSRDPSSGRVINTRGKFDMSDPDEQVYVGYMSGPDGKSFKHFEGVTSRQK